MKRADATERILSQMRERIARYAMFADEKPVLVGLSGGADSVCLTHALVSLLGRDRVCTVHLNHGLRGAESDRDEAFCEAFCRALGVPLSVRRADVAAVCGGTGIEETARNIRYAIFAEEAKRCGCTELALAHNAGDNLETMLFHLCRGTGVAGLSGIPPVRPFDGCRIVRPLLGSTREDILAYLDENGLSHVEDATNEDTRYSRNFIRHRIVPLMEEINPAALRNAAGTASSLGDVAAFLEDAADAALARDATAAPRAALLALARAPRYTALHRMVQNAGGETLDTVHTDAIVSLLETGQNGKYVCLPDGLIARLDANFLRIESAAEAAAPIAFCMPLSDGMTVLPNGGAVFLGDDPPTSKRCFSTHVSRDVLPTLCVRSRKPGDAYRYFGMTHTLKKMLTGAESAVKRERPILCDADGILWFPGFPAADGKFDKNGVLITYYESSKENNV